MISTLDGLQIDCSSKALCCYYNPSYQVQIVRIANIPNWYLEHVVFPDEYFLFEAPLAADLEVYQNGNQTPQLLKKLPCDRLQVEEGTEVEIAN